MPSKKQMDKAKVAGVNPIAIAKAQVKETGGGKAKEEKIASAIMQDINKRGKK